MSKTKSNHALHMVINILFISILVIILALYIELFVMSANIVVPMV